MDIPINTTRPSATLWFVSILTGLIGATWNFLALSLIERFVSVFPRVPDVFMDALPRIDFGVYGELFFFGLIAVFAIEHFRRQWQRTPEVILALGIMYFVRGWFLFLFPIGSPLHAMNPADRINLWGHATHAYFFGGHIAVLTVLAMFAPPGRMRWVLWIGLVVFGIGTMLSKNHYIVDSLAGVIVGYAASVWVRHRLISGAARPSPRIAGGK